MCQVPGVRQPHFLACLPQEAWWCRAEAWYICRGGYHLAARHHGHRCSSSHSVTTLFSVSSKTRNIDYFYMIASQMWATRYATAGARSATHCSFPAAACRRSFPPSSPKGHLGDHPDPGVSRQKGTRDTVWLQNSWKPNKEKKVKISLRAKGWGC